MTIMVIAALAIVSDASVWAEEIRAGVAAEQFTLPKGVPLAGYSKRHGKPSQGVHDPVGVRALVLSDGQTTAALVSCDLLIIDEDLFDAVRARLIAGGMSPHMVLLVAATHTHSGPGAYGRKFLEKISMGHFDQRVFDALAQTISGTILKASKRQVPVRVASATVLTEGLAKNRVEERGFVDRAFTVIGFHFSPTNSSDAWAVLGNFSAHPTTLNAQNRLLSGDYPGVFIRHAEQPQVPRTTAFFFAGSVGDQAPVKKGAGFERAEWIGEELARQANTLLQTLSPQPPSRLTALQERMPLPPAHVRLGKRLALPRWLGQSLVDDDATLSVLVVGDVVFFGVPCDLSAELGEQLKEAARAKGLKPMVIGFTDDYIGYCLPASAYRTHTYETLMAFNGPDTGELIVQRLIRMLNRLVIQ